MMWPESQVYKQRKNDSEENPLKILTCIKRQKITGTMKTVYLVCLVAAGAALAFGKAPCNRDDAGCVPVLKDDTPSPEPDPINCPLCEVRAIAEKCTNPDKFVPTCDGDKFAKYQYDEAKDEHFCVYVNGVEITNPATRKPGKGEEAACAGFDDLPAEPPIAKPTPCDDRKKEAGEDGDFISCEEGKFTDEQTKGKYRWCVNPNGQPIPGTFTEVGAANAPKCDFFRAFRHKCDEDGYFPAPESFPDHCTRYITCSGKVAHHCKCPAGLAWDATLNICNDWNKVTSCKGVKPFHHLT